MYTPVNPFFTIRRCWRDCESDEKMETYSEYRKSKIKVFRKGGQLPRTLKFYYDDSELSIVSSFSYFHIF